jgi:hypothetical protein
MNKKEIFAVVRHSDLGIVYCSKTDKQTTTKLHDMVVKLN